MPSRSDCGAPSNLRSTELNGPAQTIRVRTRFGIGRGKLHGQRAAGFCADDMRRLQPDRIEKIHDELHVAGKRPFEIGGNFRTRKARKIGPVQPIVQRHTRHPAPPNIAEFQGAMQEHDRLAIEPRRTQPVFPIKHLKTGAQRGHRRGGPDMVCLNFRQRRCFGGRRQRVCDCRQCCGGKPPLHQSSPARFLCEIHEFTPRCSGGRLTRILDRLGASVNEGCFVAVGRI